MTSASPRSTADKALILRAIPYGESDRVVTLLCEHLGKVSALAKSARKSQKRFAGGLGLMSLGEAALVERPAAELMRLDRFDAGAMWPGVLGDLAKIAHAGYVAELLEAMTPARQAEPAVFALAVAFMHALDEGEARAELLRVFEMGLLERVGLRPELDACVSCGRPADDAAGQRLDPHRGGVICPSCRGEGPLLDGAARHALLDARATPIAEAATLRYSADVARAARAALQPVFTTHLGRPLKSVGFIDKLNQASP